MIESQPGAVPEPLETPVTPVVEQVVTAVGPPPAVIETTSPAVTEHSDNSAVELTPIEQATALRALARELLAQSNDLVRTVQRQHRELRQLQRDLRRRR